MGSPEPDAPLHVLLNTTAGRSGRFAQRRGDLDALTEALHLAGLAGVIEPVEPGRLSERIRELGPLSRVGVAGGDGTIRTAAEALRGSATVLVPFPTGTLNHFARRIGIAEVRDAAAAAAAGGTRSAPLGVVGAGREHVFLNTAVVGAYPRVVRLRERFRPALGKWPAAAVGLAVTWARWPRFDLIVRTGGTEIRRRTAMLWIGTGRGTFPAPHEASLPTVGDGLELVLLPPGGRRQALRLLRALRGRRRGRGPEAVGLEVLRAREVEIDTHDHHHLHLTLDAEPLVVRPPVRVALEERALRVADARPSGHAVPLVDGGRPPA